MASLSPRHLSPVGGPMSTSYSGETKTKTKTKTEAEAELGNLSQLSGQSRPTFDRPLFVLSIQMKVQKLIWG